MPTAYTITDNGKLLEVKELTFESHKIRVAWSRDEEKFYFSIVDCVGMLTEQPTAERAGTYWRVMKKRLTDEGNETVTNCNGLKLRAADGKGYFKEACYSFYHPCRRITFAER